MEESVKETLGDAYDLLAGLLEGEITAANTPKIKEVLNQINDELYKHL